MVPEKAIQNWCLLKTGSTCMVKLPYAQSLDGIHPEPWIDYQNFFLLLEFKTWKNNCPPRYSHNVHLSNLRNISRLHAYHASCMCSRLYMQYTLGPHRWRKSRQQVGWAVGELSSVVWAWRIFGWKIFDPQFVSQNVRGCIKRITPMKSMFHFFLELRQCDLHKESRTGHRDDYLAVLSWNLVAKLLPGMWARKFSQQQLADTSYFGSPTFWLAWGNLATGHPCGLTGFFYLNFSTLSPSNKLI